MFVMFAILLFHIAIQFNLNSEVLKVCLVNNY